MHMAFCFSLLSCSFDNTTLKQKNINNINRHEISIVYHKSMIILLFDRIIVDVCAYLNHMQ